MRRFVVTENIRRYERLLLTEGDPGARGTILALLQEAKRELAKLEAAPFGSRDMPLGS